MITGALSVTGILAAIEHALRMGPTDDPAIARTIADAVSSSITFADQDAAAQALKDFYTAAGGIGADAAGQQLGADVITSLPSVQELVDASLQRVQGIVDTQRDIISTAVRDGVMNGSSAQTIAGQINETLLDPARSQLIAVTEGNRAYAAATIDSYQAAGISQFNWVAYDDACEECIALEEGSPYDVSDEIPPDHPNCRCYTTAVIDTGDSTP